MTVLTPQYSTTAWKTLSRLEKSFFKAAQTTAREGVLEYTAICKQLPVVKHDRCRHMRRTIIEKLGRAAWPWTTRNPVYEGSTKPRTGEEDRAVIEQFWANRRIELALLAAPRPPLPPSPTTAETVARFLREHKRGVNFLVRQLAYTR